MFCQELAATIARDVQPQLQEANIALRCVGIGTLPVARDFCDHVGFDRELLYADPENAAYSALGLKKGLQITFFTVDTPFAIMKRAQSGTAGDLLRATARWKPVIPPKLDQGLQQGGAFVFEGDKLLLGHYDPSTGAHVDLDEVLRAALAK